MADTNELRHIIQSRVEEYQQWLNNIEIYESLCKFGDLGPFNRDFLSELDWLRDIWLDDESNECFDSRRVYEIEDKLVQLPFEQALMYKEPEYRTQSLHEITSSKFGEDVSWRNMPEIVMSMSREDKLHIYANFEYMYYYVINVREELIFDIRNRLGLAVE